MHPASLPRPPTKLQQDVLSILAAAKRLAQRYRALTGKPLGITGEVAEYEAARLLGVQLTPPRQAGYDATETVGGKLRRLQIKGRCLLPDAKPGQRLGAIEPKTSRRSHVIDLYGAAQTFLATSKYIWPRFEMSAFEKSEIASNAIDGFACLKVATFGLFW